MAIHCLFSEHIAKHRGAAIYSMHTFAALTTSRVAESVTTLLLKLKGMLPKVEPTTRPLLTQGGWLRKGTTLFNLSFHANYAPEGNDIFWWYSKDTQPLHCVSCVHSSPVIGGLHNTTATGETPSGVLGGSSSISTQPLGISVLWFPTTVPSGAEMRRNAGSVASGFGELPLYPSIVIVDKYGQVRSSHASWYQWPTGSLLCPLCFSLVS